MIIFSYKTSDGNFNSDVINLPADIVNYKLSSFLGNDILFPDYIYNKNISCELSSKPKNGYYKLRVYVECGSVFDFICDDISQLEGIKNKLSWWSK